MKREDIVTAYNISSEIKECEDILLLLSLHCSMQIQVYSQYGESHSIEVIDDTEMYSIIAEHLKKRKKKLEKTLETLL